MIALKKYDSNFQNIENTFSRKFKKEEIIEFYNKFIINYNTLNSKYGFNAYIDSEYIYNQIDLIFFNRNKPLSFIPFGIKDIFNTNILPTSMGSKIWDNFKAGNNSRVVDNIINSGGIVFSKTTTAEFAVHFITPGQTKNPNNINHITGTSSSGSAVSVACGALPVALGTQTAGSIIRPASFCGVYGFKPSFGAIDRTGVLKTNDTFDTIGLLSSDIYGIQKTFSNIFQKGNDYPYSINFHNNFKKYKNKNKKYKIGVLGASLNVLNNITKSIMNDFEFIISQLNLRHDLIELKTLGFLNQVHTIHENMYAKSLSYYFQNEIKQNDNVSQIMTEMIKKGEGITSEEYVKISKLQPSIIKKVDEILEDIDFIIVPSTSTAAPKLGDTELDDTCLLWTYLGYPAISIPLFKEDITELPVGLQIIAKKYDDFALLDFAEYISKSFN
jgi:Asp-tRNA(Asn)/Glu-tRNA(Gln) amidotransferase A subunit family amidase